ncbi:Crp/Fnr family transcriptional regulator [Flavicella sp.]|uniref:Crp/Fnr family transcriptional regulator n=1 Tax=Flavicella sp. TaxID=2957742 RepID=UPI0030191E56
MNELYIFMNNISPLSETSYNIYMDMCKNKTFKAGTILTEIDTVPEYLYFIKTGVARSFSVTEKGVEYIRSLVSTNNILAATEALITKQPSKVACQCLTDCDVIVVDYNLLTQKCKENIEIAGWYTKILELHYMNSQKINTELLTMNATQRYLILQKRIPNIDNLINQYHIASRLGITPIQLSRIRKKLYSK